MQSTLERSADRVPSDGVRDAVSVLIHEYPTRVTTNVLGGSEDKIETFSALVETVLNAMTGVPGAAEKTLDAHEAPDAFMLRLFEQKRARRGEDLITDLIQAETEDGTLRRV